jgi:hypothetical protein
VNSHIRYPWPTPFIEDADDIDGPPDRQPPPPSPLPPTHWARMPRVGRLRREQIQDERTNSRGSGIWRKPS